MIPSSPINSDYLVQLRKSIRQPDPGGGGSSSSRNVDGEASRPHLDAALYWRHAYLDAQQTIGHLQSRLIASGRTEDDGLHSATKWTKRKGAESDPPDPITQRRSKRTKTSGPLVEPEHIDVCVASVLNLHEQIGQPESPKSMLNVPEREGQSY